MNLSHSSAPMPIWSRRRSHTRTGMNPKVKQDQQRRRWIPDRQLAFKSLVCTHDESQVVNTSWAVLALISARYPDAEKIRNGLQLLMDRQEPNGEWLQEDIEGVFNRTCMIGYPNYKFYFPIRALGKYEQVYVPWLTEHKESAAKKH